MIAYVTQSIKDAKSLLLTTHKQCDGDGLGAQLGMYHALKAIGKKVRLLNVDATPHKYRFLEPDTHIQYFDSPHDPIEPVDLAVVFDTNDYRLVEPLYSELEKKAKKIIFIDHHPVLKTGPEPTEGSYIDTSAASTGEMAYNMIQALNIPLSKDMAQAIYTSVAFDTQLFRFVRNSAKSHEIAAETLKLGVDAAKIHKQMFGNFTANKLKFLSKVLSNIEFYYEDKLGFLHIKTEHLENLGLTAEDSRDLVDTMMNVEAIEVAALIREDEGEKFKLSLRSKGFVHVNGLAEEVGGGGHIFSAGASTEGYSAEQLKTKIVEFFKHSLA